MINQSNCSEECFRLTGNLEEIKESVIKMLDAWVSEQKKEEINFKEAHKDGDAEPYVWWKTQLSKVKKLKKIVENIKNISEFEGIYFPFTTNYETFFQEDNEDLIVATCNNENWNEYLEFEEEKPDDYWDYARIAYYDKIVFQNEKFLILKRNGYEDATDEEEKEKEKERDERMGFPKILILKGKGDLRKEGFVKVIHLKDYIVEDIPFKEVKDGDLKNKLLTIAGID